MNKSLFARFFLLSTLFFLIIACAKISAPTGGLRDKLPPEVIKSIPENGAKNFNEKRIAITFNEYVVLDNISEKFMVSPPMKKKPRVFIKGKSVNVEFEDELKDSTTYTFYFQDAIKDLNEGNIIENFQFVFSTGPVIDSLSITGYVYSAFNLEVPEKTQVLMYSEMADSAVVKHLPDYISRVDQNGYFRIDNARPGKYRLYALKDVDNSKNYNLAEEEFAFMNSAIEITPEKNFIPVVKDTTTFKKGIIKAPQPVIVNGEYQLILFEAQKKNPRPIMVDVYTTWCGPCKMMSAYTFGHPVIAKYLNENFYPVKFNAETRDSVIFNGNLFVNHSPAGTPRPVHDFAVSILDNKLMYPSIVFLNEELSRINTMAGYYKADQFEPALKYFGSGKYKNTTFEDFQKTFVAEVK